MNIYHRSRTHRCNTQILGAILFLIIFHTSASHASEQVLKFEAGKVQKVRLYTDRAEIFRKISLQLPVGSSKIELGPFPISLITDSIRISPAAKSSAQIGNFSTKKSYSTQFQDESIKKQEARTELYRLKLNSIKDELKTLEDQINYIENLNGEKIPAKVLPGPDYWDSILEFKATRGKVRRDRFREVLVKSQIAEKELIVEEKILQDMKAGTKKEALNITVNVRTDQPNIDINVSYQIRNTTWRPAYTLRTDTRKKIIHLEYVGQINQRTGEDWNNVSLELTTSQPSRGTTPPKLRPWVVDYHQPQKQIRMLESFSGAKRNRAMSMAAQADGAVMGAEAVKSGSSFTFKIPDKQTIATGTKNFRTLIFSKQFDAELIYTSIPKNTQNVFLKAKSQNSSPFQLLPGSTKNFVDGSFVGKSWFKDTAPEQKFELGLGVDESIKVKRKLIKKEGSDAGIFDSTQKQRYIFEISLENFKDVPVQVELKDQLPLSYQEEIKIRINEINPKPSQTDKQNFLTWKVDLNPLEKKVITLDFQVDYPEGKTLSGL